MAGLLQKAGAWLTGMMQTAASPAGAITYIRGAERFDLTGLAWVGNTLFRRNPRDTGPAVEWGERDYLIPVSALSIEPAKGDRIEEVIDGETLKFDVLAPGGEKASRYSDHERTTWRVHTKSAGTNG